MTNADKVYELVAKIPQGKVLRYGDVAAMTGIKNPRVIGNLLHQNPDSQKTPCHRVVNAQGRLAPAYAFGGVDVQKEKLEKEGVVFRDNLVDLSRSLWRQNHSPKISLT